MGDGNIFPGSKEIMSVWDTGKERFNDGLRRGEIIIIKDWPIKGKEFIGGVVESWDKGQYQFFTLEHSEKCLRDAFMGVSFCPHPDDGLYLVVNEVKKEINCRYFTDFFPGSGLTVKRITIRDEERLSFLFDLFFFKNKNFCSYARVDNQEIEKKLDEAIEKFEKECLTRSQK